MSWQNPVGLEINLYAPVNSRGASLTLKVCHIFHIVSIVLKLICL